MASGEATAAVDGERAPARRSGGDRAGDGSPHSLLNIGEGVLRVLGVFSSSTLVATFAEPLAPGGPQVMVAGAPVPIATPLDEAVPA